MTAGETCGKLVAFLNEIDGGALWATTCLKSMYGGQTPALYNLSMEIEGQEVPEEIALAMAVNPIRHEYETWRVVAYNTDGTWFYIPNNQGEDYKLERNARKGAEFWNRTHWPSPRWCQPSFAVVKRVKITESEIE